MSNQPDGFDLALAFDSAADAIKKRLFADWNKLTQPRREELEREFWSLQQLAMRLRTVTVGALLAQAQTSVSDLQQITARAAHDVQTLNDIRKAIKVATAVLGLAAAVTASVAAPNPASIGGALTALKGVIDAANE